MSKHIKPEIEPLPEIPAIPPPIPEITPIPDKNKPEQPLPEIIPSPSPEIKPIKEDNININRLIMVEKAVLVKQENAKVNRMFDLIEFAT